jgi:chemotaxis receptor (MCP) glutamine deamidase CheD
MTDIEKIKEQLKDRNLKVVAEKAGVSYGQTVKFMDNTVKKPSYDFIEKLKAYLEI